MESITVNDLILKLQNLAVLGFGDAPVCVLQSAKNPESYPLEEFEKLVSNVIGFGFGMELRIHRQTIANHLGMSEHEFDAIAE